MIEVRVRAFLKAANGASVVPSTTLVTGDAAPALDVAALAKRLVDELDGSPLGELRPMTADEIEAYCAEEEAEDGYTDLGLSDADLEEPGR